MNEDLGFLKKLIVQAEKELLELELAEADKFEIKKARNYLKLQKSRLKLAKIELDEEDEKNLHLIDKYLF